MVTKSEEQERHKSQRVSSRYGRSYPRLQGGHPHPTRAFSAKPTEQLGHPRPSSRSTSVLISSASLNVPVSPLSSFTYPDTTVQRAFQHHVSAVRTTKGRIVSCFHPYRITRPGGLIQLTTTTVAILHNQTQVYPRIFTYPELHRGIQRATG